MTTPKCPPVMSIGFMSEISAISGLSVKEYIAWRRLVIHLHWLGELPVDAGQLANLCHVRLKTFQKMAPQIAKHFDLSPQGAWTHDEVLAVRADQLHSCVVIPFPGSDE